MPHNDCTHAGAALFAKSSKERFYHVFLRLPVHSHTGVLHLKIHGMLVGPARYIDSTAFSLQCANGIFHSITQRSLHFHAVACDNSSLRFNAKKHIWEKRWVELFADTGAQVGSIYVLDVQYILPAHCYKIAHTVDKEINLKQYLAPPFGSSVVGRCHDFFGIEPNNRKICLHVVRQLRPVSYAFSL